MELKKWTLEELFSYIIGYRLNMTNSGKTILENKLK